MAMFSGFTAYPKITEPQNAETLEIFDQGRDDSYTIQNKTSRDCQNLKHQKHRKMRKFCSDYTQLINTSSNLNKYKIQQTPNKRA